MPEQQKLRIKHLDRQLMGFRRELDVPPPTKGWLHEIRLALGMNLRQFAARMGSLAPQNANAIEKSEADGKISLNALNAAAQALGCELVYAVVPRGSLEALIRARVEEVARQRINRVAHTMSLESQSVTSAYLDSEVRQLIAEMTANPPKDLWESQPFR